MTNSTNSSSLLFSREKCIYYAVLKALFDLRRQNEMYVSAMDIQKYIEYFTIPIGQIEEVLDELYHHSFLMREEFPSEERQYILTLI